MGRRLAGTDSSPLAAYLSEPHRTSIHDRITSNALGVRLLVYFDLRERDVQIIRIIRFLYSNTIYKYPYPNRFNVISRIFLSSILPAPLFSHRSRRSASIRVKNASAKMSFSGLLPQVLVTAPLQCSRKRRRRWFVCPMYNFRSLKLIRTYIEYIYSI